LISIYYQVRELEPIQVELKKIAFDFNEAHIQQHRETGQAEVFRFVPWNEFGPDILSFPIDKIVAGKIKTNGLLMKTIG
jgi:hypothetical protein